MSTTTVKGINPGEPADDILELRNSHGSAPVIWDTMAQKYLGLAPFAYSFNDEKLWPLWKDLSIPEHHRAVLGMTYDGVVVSKSDYERAARDIRAFLVDFPPNPEYVNHWVAIAEMFEGKPDYEGIGFHWTSVSEDPFEGEYDEETEEYGPVNLDGKWSLYHFFDKNNKENKNAKT